MRTNRIFIIVIAVLLLSAGVFGQTKRNAGTPTGSPPAIKSTPAYAEVLLRKTELQSELESLLVEYTEEYPRVKELHMETAMIQEALDRLLAVNPADGARLSLALGKLMVRKAALETDLWNLRRQYKDDHPDVKRAKRRVEIFEAAINEILSAR